MQRIFLFWMPASSHSFTILVLGLLLPWLFYVPIPINV